MKDKENMFALRPHKKSHVHFISSGSQISNPIS